jgi:integrase
MTIRVRRSKTRKARSVPVSDPALLTMILDALREGLPARTPLHIALRRGFRLHPEIQPFGPKAMRHSRASLWVNARLPLQNVAAWLGHSVRELERTYLHVVHHDLTPPPSGLLPPDPA